MGEMKETAGAEAPAAERNRVLVINRAGGRKLVIRISADDPDDTDELGDAVMVEIFDDDMGKDFNPDGFEMGHGSCMAAELFTEAIRRVVDAPSGYIL